MQGSICHMLGFFLSSAYGKYFQIRWRHAWEDMTFVLLCAILSSQPPSAPDRVLAKKTEIAPSAQGRGPRVDRSWSNRLGGIGVLRVKAWDESHPWVHGPERKARHSVWQSGQIGTEWEQTEERAWNESAVRRTGPQCQRPTHLAPCPDMRGWAGLVETRGHRKQTTPFPTLPAANSSWTLVTSSSLSWCICFLVLPSGKVGVFLFNLTGESNQISWASSFSRYNTHTYTYIHVLCVCVCVF